MCKLTFAYDRGFISIIRAGTSKYYKGYSKIEGDNIQKYNNAPNDFPVEITNLDSFSEVIATNKIFSGKLSEEDAEAIHTSLGGYKPDNCFIIPFKVYERTVAIMYCDDKPNKQKSLKDIDQILILANTASLAMQINILNEKITSR